MLTLNQTIEILKNFSLKHKSLNSFYLGDEWEVEASNEMNYPMLNAVILPVSTDNKMMAVTRKFQIIISDLTNRDESNETLVLSDTEQICFDLLNYLEQVSDSGLLGAFKVNLATTLTDFTERNDSYVSGWFFELELITDVSGLSCNLPISSGNILDDNYIYVGGQVPISNSFQVEIKDQNGNVIQTFTTSGEYMVTLLTNIQQVIGNNTTTVIQDIN